MTKKIEQELRATGIKLDSDDIYHFKRILNLVPEETLQNPNFGLLSLAKLQFYTDAGYNISFATKILGYYCRKGGKNKKQACSLLRKARKRARIPTPKFTRRSRLFDDRRGAREFIHNAFLPPDYDGSKRHATRGGDYKAIKNFYIVLSEYILTNNKIDLNKFQKLRNVFDITYDADYIFGPKHEKALLFLIQNNALPNIEEIRKRFDYEWLGQGQSKKDTKPDAGQGQSKKDTKPDAGRKAPMPPKGTGAMKPATAVRPGDAAKVAPSAGANIKKYRQSAFEILLILKSPAAFKMGYEDLKTQGHPLVKKMQQQNKTFEELLKQRDKLAIEVLNNAKKDAKGKKNAELIKKMTSTQNKSIKKDPISPDTQDRLLARADDLRIRESKSNLDLLIIKEYKRFLNEQETKETPEQRRARILARSKERREKRKGKSSTAEKEIKKEANRAAKQMNNELRKMPVETPEGLSLLWGTVIAAATFYASFRYGKRALPQIERLIPGTMSNTARKVSQSGQKLYDKLQAEKLEILNVATKIDQSSAGQVTQAQVAKYIEEIVKAEGTLWSALRSASTRIDVKKRSSLNTFADKIKTEFNNFKETQSKALTEIEKILTNIDRSKLTSTEKQLVDRLVNLINKQRANLVEAGAKIIDYSAPESGAISLLKFIYSFSGWRYVIGGTSKTKYFKDLIRTWKFSFLRVVKLESQFIKRIKDALISTNKYPAPPGLIAGIPVIKNLFPLGAGAQRSLELFAAFSTAKYATPRILEALNLVFDDYVTAPSEIPGVGDWLYSEMYGIILELYDNDEEKTKELINNIGEFLDGTGSAVMTVFKFVGTASALGDTLKVLEEVTFAVFGREGFDGWVKKQREKFEDTVDAAAKEAGETVDTAKEMKKAAAREVEAQLIDAKELMIKRLLNKSEVNLEQTLKGLFSFMYLIKVVRPRYDTYEKFDKIDKQYTKLMSDITKFLAAAAEAANPEQKSQLCGIVQKASDDAFRIIEKFKNNLDIKTLEQDIDGEKLYSLYYDDITIKDKQNILRSIVLDQSLSRKSIRKIQKIIRAKDPKNKKPVYEDAVVDAALNIRERMFRQYILDAQDFEQLGRPLASADLPPGVTMGPDGVPVDSEGREVEVDIDRDSEFGEASSIFNILGKLDFESDYQSQISEKIKKFIQGSGGTNDLKNLNDLLSHLPKFDVEGGIKQIEGQFKIGDRTYDANSTEGEAIKYIMDMQKQFKGFPCLKIIGEKLTRTAGKGFLISDVYLQDTLGYGTDDIRDFLGTIENYRSQLYTLCVVQEAMTEKKTKTGTKAGEKYPYSNYLQNPPPELREPMKDYLNELLETFLENEIFDDQVAKEIEGGASDEEDGMVDKEAFKLAVGRLKDSFDGKIKLAQADINKVKQSLKCGGK